MKLYQNASQVDFAHPRFLPLKIIFFKQTRRLDLKFFERNPRVRYLANKAKVDTKT